MIIMPSSRNTTFRVDGGVLGEEGRSFRQRRAEQAVHGHDAENLPIVDHGHDR
jgi:hypothetical protein